ncbi:MAG: transporter substrate-binding domain-containing protein [Selenomonadaceae bacterium]|nr:transporter substrate-binding domain-containing protein [Selenomonadaceae bacterium]
MKLKKVAKLLLSCVLAGALFTGCGGGQQGGDDKPAHGEAPIKLGMITHLNATETRMADILKMVQEESGIPVSKYNITYYENLNNLQMGLESGSVDEVSLYKCVADFALATNDKFEVVKNDNLKNLADSFCFAVRKEDSALKDDLNKVIDEMKTDGTLDKLIDEYITKVDKKQVPPKIEIPMTEGAQTIKVGVTGDLPPLDFVNTDGTPAGFNTALLAEVAKRLGRNVELVDIDSGARAAALSSKQIDVIFWAIVPVGEKIPDDIDKPENVEMSKPYFKDDVAHLKLKK